MMDNSLGVTPVYNLDRNNDGGVFGGNGSWIFFLFFLLAWGGGNFGGFGGNGATSEISNDFMYSNLNNTLGRIQDQNTYNMNTLQQGLCTLGYDNLSQFKDLTAQLANCCCTTQKEILINRFDNERNTCNIVNAIHAEGEQTRALMNQNTIQELRDRLQSAELGLSQLAQTSNIVNQVRPCPKPAYLTNSPYYSYNPCNPCGCNGMI